MFFRTKTSGTRSYLQVVENRWEDGRPKQRVIATLGRLDHLQQTGQLAALLASGARVARSVLLLSAHAKGQIPTVTTRRIGPALIFERLWQQTGCRHVIEQLLKGRHFEFDVERAIFLTVLHRLFDSGSDRAADKWRTDYQIDGCDDLQLHHLFYEFTRSVKGPIRLIPRGFLSFPSQGGLSLGRSPARTSPSPGPSPGSLGWVSLWASWFS